jgi:hypothetical protein
VADRLYQLHALDVLLRETKQSRSKFYQDFNKQNTKDVTTVGRAHMDGGAQTTTTSDLSLLWHMQYFAKDAKVATLRVADETAHYPTGYGYLKVPSLTGEGHEMVACFYTPTLPATLLSPDRVGHANGCEGYSTLSLFKESARDACELRLHHCKRSAQDILFPLTSIRGLLFTQPLVKPTKAEQESLLPKTTVYVCPKPAAASEAPSETARAASDDTSEPTDVSSCALLDSGLPCPCASRKHGSTWEGSFCAPASKVASLATDDDYVAPEPIHDDTETVIDDAPAPNDDDELVSPTGWWVNPDDCMATSLSLHKIFLHMTTV